MSTQLEFPELRPSEIEEAVAEIDRALDAYFLGEIDDALQRARAAQDAAGASPPAA